jgi:hypothetical protein
MVHVTFFYEPKRSRYSFGCDFTCRVELEAQEELESILSAVNQDSFRLSHEDLKLILARRLREAFPTSEVTLVILYQGEKDSTTEVRGKPPIFSSRFERMLDSL